MNGLAFEDSNRNYLIIINAIVRFEGDLNILERSVGMYLVGQVFGWKVLRLVHHHRTIKKYEEILNIKIKKEFMSRGPLSHRSKALLDADEVGNYWKIVRGGLKGARSPEVIATGSLDRVSCGTP